MFAISTAKGRGSPSSDGGGLADFGPSMEVEGGKGVDGCLETTIYDAIKMQGEGSDGLDGDEADESSRFRGWLSTPTPLPSHRQKRNHGLSHSNFQVVNAASIDPSGLD